MIELGERSKEVINVLFPPKHSDLAAELLLNECGDNLALCENHSSEQMERIRLAALKISMGDVTKLQEAISLAQTDWRDLLVVSGFGSDLNAHLKWAKSPLKKDRGFAYYFGIAFPILIALLVLIAFLQKRNG